MTAFPQNRASHLTERIMARVREHLQPDPPGQPFHYNRTYELVYEELARVPGFAAPRPPTASPRNLARPASVRCLDECVDRWALGRRCKHNRTAADME